MSSPHPSIPTFEFHLLTPERWHDLEGLFGERGDHAGCWCMWWRITRAQFARNGRKGNKQALQTIVGSGEIPGLLAYSNGEPIAWCSVAPRERFPALDRSRTLKRFDDEPVWSVVCFFVAKPFRRKGITALLLKAAVEYAKKQGAKIVEGYPVEQKNLKGWSSEGFTGMASTFGKAGFVEMLRRSENRPIMRKFIEEQ